MKTELCDPLTHIFNQCVAKSIFPSALKIAKIIPLHKKDDISIFNNYRPISLLPSISKVFEKLLHVQIYSFFMDNQLFYSSQYGFRNMHSTELAAIELIDNVLLYLDEGKSPISIFLDLSKAFDTIDHNILLNKLKYYGFNNESLTLISSYLCGRKQYVEFEDVCSNKLPVVTGVPQGSVLGPLFFIIYINDICKATTLFHPTIYADDTTLTATLNTFENEGNPIHETINFELSKISNWMKANKLSLNCDKTKAMIFHMPQKSVTVPKLSINDVDIQFVKHFNFLGITVDENLSWKNHIHVIATKISKTVGILNNLKHFLPRDVLLSIYNSLILPYLNYGIVLWENHLHRLFGLQKKAVRVMTKSKYNAHTEPIFKSLKILKCQDLCALQYYKFCYKLENKLLPSYFLENDLFRKNAHVHNYNTTRRNFFHIPRVKHNFAKSSIRFRIPNFFNSMNSDIRSKIYSHSMQSFKTFIKKFIIDSYSSVCTNTACYICNRK
jgi:hypothetical protein